MKTKSEKNPPVTGGAPPATTAGAESKKLTLAEFLKQRRHAKGYSLDRLSELTKIQAYHLKALEEGRVDALPPLVYRAGIFKRLAKFLEIDEREILELYDGENPPAVGPVPVDKALLPKKDFYFILTPKKMTLFLGGLLLFGLTAYLWYQFNFLVGPPTLVIEPKEDLITADEMIPFLGRTDSGVNLTVNGETIYVAPDGNFSKNVQLAAGLNVIEVSAINSFGKTAKVIRQIFREINQ